MCLQMDRLEHLAAAIKLERLWDNVAGPDNHPERKALEPQIKHHRKEYERMTEDFIKARQTEVVKPHTRRKKE